MRAPTPRTLVSFYANEKRPAAPRRDCTLAAGLHACDETFSTPGWCSTPCGIAALATPSPAPTPSCRPHTRCPAHRRRRTRCAIHLMSYTLCHARCAVHVMSYTLCHARRAVHVCVLAIPIPASSTCTSTVPPPFTSTARHPQPATHRPGLEHRDPERFAVLCEFCEEHAVDAGLGGCDARHCAL